MKNMLVLLIFCISIFSVKAQSIGLAKLDEKNGFKSIILGDSITNYKDFPVIGDQGSRFYDGNSAGLNIGDVKLKSIGISVYKGRISSIIIFFNPEDGNKINNVLKEAYGFYTEKPNRYMEKYYWDSKNVSLSLDYDSKNKNGSMMLSSKQLMQEERDDNKQKDKKAVNDL